MDGALSARLIESVMAWASSLVLAGAVAIASLNLGFAAATAAALAVLGFGAGYLWQWRLSVRFDDFALPRFEPAAVPGHDDELLLVEPIRIALSAELILDDALPRPDPQSRVIRLFGTAPLPTAGELHARIDRHLGRSGDAQERPTSDLGQANDDLRRSLA